MRKLFKKYQKELLAFVNSKYGREFVNIAGSEIKEGYPIVKITPESVHQFIGLNEGKPLIRAIFFPGAKFAERLSSVLTKLDVAKEYRLKNELLMPLVIPHFLGSTQLLKSVLPTVMLTTTTFNPTATAVDGDAGATLTSNSWATKIAEAGDTSEYAAATFYIFMIRANGGVNTFLRLRRGIVMFDTSSLGSGATISAATLSGYGADSLQEDAAVTPNANVYGATPAGTSSLANGDFAQTGSTSFSTAIAWASLTLSAYNDWVLNASGIANISLTGVSKFSIKNANYDVANSAPNYLSTAQEHFRIQGYVNTNPPKLVVTYTTASTSVGGTLPMMGI